MFGAHSDPVEELLKDLDAVRITDLHVTLFIFVGINLNFLLDFIGSVDSPPVKKLEDFWKELVVLDKRLELSR